MKAAGFCPKESPVSVLFCCVDNTSCVAVSFLFSYAVTLLCGTLNMNTCFQICESVSGWNDASRCTVSSVFFFNAVWDFLSRPRVHSHAVMSRSTYFYLHGACLLQYYAGQGLSALILSPARHGNNRWMKETSREEEAEASTALGQWYTRRSNGIFKMESHNISLY